MIPVPHINRTGNLVLDSLKTIYIWILVPKIKSSFGPVLGASDWNWW